MSVRAVAVGLLLQAGCGRIAFDERNDAAGSTVCPTTELCNGIDDTCEGLVDEGCPCTPFTVMHPFRLERTMVSTGTDWILFTNPTGGFGAATRLDISTQNAVVGAPPLIDALVSNWKLAYAWNGSELVYVRFDGSVGFADAQGNPVRNGPATGLPPGVGWLRWNGKGFDIALMPIPGQDAVSFVSTDAQGIATTGSARTDAWQVVLPISVMTRNGAPFLFWYEQDPTFTGRPAVGTADPPNHIVTTVLPAVTGLGLTNDADSDGVHALMLFETGLVVFDDSGARPLGLVLPGTPESVAWTGRGWEVAVADRNSNPMTVSLVHLTETFAIASTDLVFALQPGAVAPVSVVADARRSLVGFHASIGVGPTMAYLAQLCH